MGDRQRVSERVTETEVSERVTETEVSERVTETETEALIVIVTALYRLYSVLLETLQCICK